VVLVVEVLREDHKRSLGAAAATAKTILVKIIHIVGRKIVVEVAEVVHREILILLQVVPVVPVSFSSPTQHKYSKNLQ
jgi:hypothetical protein